MNNPPEDEEDYFIWEEYDYESNKLYYEYDLEYLENQPRRQKNANNLRHNRREEY